MAETLKETDLVVHEVEDDAVIVNLNGWRMRVYFDKGVKKDSFHYGKEITVNYTGDIEKAPTVKFEKLK